MYIIKDPSLKKVKTRLLQLTDMLKTNYINILIRECSTWVGLTSYLCKPMSFGSNGISSSCKNKVEGEVMGSRTILCVCNY